MKKGLSILIAISLLVLAMSPAQAGSINAVLNGKSYHLDSSYDWNENNTGLGVEYEFAQKSAWKKILMANGFRDSTDNMSYMAGRGIAPPSLRNRKTGWVLRLRGTERIPDDARRRQRQQTVSGNPAERVRRQQEFWRKSDLFAAQGR